jgi:two-component system, sensor histidine kinase
MLLLDAIALFSFKAKEKNLSLHYEIEPRTPKIIETDSTRLQQILMNLLSNAIKFSESGQVSISVKAHNQNQLLFAVRDTGIGIPPKKVESLFKPFSQVDMSATRQFGGSGLGLVICKQMVEMMGGEIWLESEIHKGSTFWFTIPTQLINLNVEYLGRSETKVTRGSSSNRKNPSYKHQILNDLTSNDLSPQSETSTSVLNQSDGAKNLMVKILIAEDNPVNQKVISHLLRKFGYSADIVTNGLEVLELTDKQTYDLIFMDVQMPEMDGLEATRQLVQKWTSEQRPKIIALTANALEGDREICLASGMDDYISKPFQPEQLQAAILKWVKK